MATWPDADHLEAVQATLAAATPPPWTPPVERPLRVGGCFVAFERGEQGPGRAGDRAWGGAALVDEAGHVEAAVAVPGLAGSPYVPGRLALREGPTLEAAARALPVRPDVLLVDATGRDHPRRAGLALHLGAVLDLPTVGVTHRGLVVRGDPDPPWPAGATWPGTTPEGDEVARWLATAGGVRPVLVHPGWRTDLDVAVAVVRRAAGRVRTPLPLRAAREAARRARHGRRHPGPPPR